MSPTPRKNIKSELRIAANFKEYYERTLSKLMNRSNPSRPTAEPAFIPMME